MSKKIHCRKKSFQRGGRGKVPKQHKKKAEGEHKEKNEPRTGEAGNKRFHPIKKEFQEEKRSSLAGSTLQIKESMANKKKLRVKERVKKISRDSTGRPRKKPFRKRVTGI